MTDNAAIQQLDSTSLEPVSGAEHSMFHPHIRGPIAAAHFRIDPIMGNPCSFILQVCLRAIYRAFCISASTGKTSVIATISGCPVLAAYVRSFMLTGSHVIICIFNAYFVVGGLTILWSHDFLDALESPPF